MRDFNPSKNGSAVNQHVESSHETTAVTKAVLDNIVNGIITIDPQGVIRSFNLAAEDIFGYSESEVTGENVKLLMPEPYHSEHDAYLSNYAHTGEAKIICIGREVVGKRKDGSTFPLELAVSKVPIDDQTLFTGIVRDITQRKQAEQEILDREARLHAILDTAVSGIITINDHGIIESCNQASEKLFGYTAEELIGSNVNILMPEPYTSNHDSYLENYRQTGKAKIIGIGREVPGKRKDGSIFPMDLSVAEVKLGNTHLFTGIVSDITERKQAEEELFTAMEATEKANLAKSAFLSRMSHELRTPLNAIVGFAQVLEMGDPNDREKESIGHILKAGRHLTDLINEVLDIARIESGRQNLSPEPVNVCRVLEDTWNLIYPLAKERNIQPRESIPAECNVYVLADLQRLKQVLLNLMSNAIKYNHDGGGITLYCSEPQSGIIRISVADTGPGIAEENRERVFEAFERLGADEQKVEGSGVGLALSKALIRAMGGQLSFDSEVGKGSTFWVELPQTDDPGQNVNTNERHTDTVDAAEKHQLQARSILYIEDNVSNLRLVEVALSRYKEITLIPAMQGQLGIELALRHKPDVILLDVHLPDLSGYEVLNRLRSHPETQNIPVVILSADATTRQINRLLAGGAHAYLTKPFNIKELIKTLNDAVIKNR